MKKFCVILFTVLLGIGVFLGDVSSVSAQEVVKQEFVLDEIVVTAERREQSLQDVPVSATVFTSENMEDKGINNVIDLQQFSPSVAINTYNRSTYVNIRGVGIAQSAPTSNPGVAYYIDGVYIPHEQWISHSFYDIAAIEVLRGPQGTLTGQNSTGGAIYARTPAPDFTGLSGYIDQTIADSERYRTIAAVNVPMGKKFAIRIAGTYNTQGSFTENIGPSESEPGSGDLISGRFGLRFKPTDGLTFDLRYEQFDYDTDYNAIKNRNDAVTSDPFKIEEDAISFLKQKGYRASAEGRINITEGMQLRVLASKFDVDNQDQADGDRTATDDPIPEGLPANSANRALYPGRVSLTTQELETWVGEVNLLSSGEGSLQWVVGAFYMDENTPTSVYRDHYHTTDFVSPSGPGISIETEADNTSWSGFGQVDYRLSEAFEVGVGLRYSEDKQDYTRYAVPGPPPAPGVLPYTSSIESDETTGRLGVKYFMNPETMFYATASKGYKAGGVNLGVDSGVFEPETNKVYETGVKTTLADGRLRINGDVFYSDYEGIQLSALVAGAPNTQNAASGEIYGLELETLGQFDALGFNLGLSLINGEFAEDTTITNGNALPRAVDQLVPAGTDLPFCPDVTITAGIQYDFWINKMLLAPRLQVSYMSEQQATAFPGPKSTVPEHTVVDLRVMMNPTDNIRLEAFVTNLLDEEYIAVQLQDASSATGGYIYGAPRQYGIRAKYIF